MRVFLKSLLAGWRSGRFALVFAMVLCAACMTGRADAAQASYLLETTTGASTGTENTIEFFAVNYRDSANRDRIKFLFPYENSLKEGYDQAAAVNKEQEERDAYIRSTYGYEGQDLTERAPFQAYQTDQYLFDLPVEIKTVEQVQMFAGGSGSWSCQAIRLFRVDEVGGLYRSNDASGDGYIDFAGELLAECSVNNSIDWTSDKLFTFAMTTGFRDGQRTHALQHDGQKTLAVRFDFADAYGAGLESLATSKDNTIRGMGPVETAALTLRYTDRYGAVRETSVAGILNAAEWAIAKGAKNSESFTGLAQQGETLTVGVFLPDYDTLYLNSGVTLTLGASEAEKVLNFKTTGGKSRRSASESDTADVVTTAIYELTGKNGTVEVAAAIDSGSGALRYQFTGDPSAYHMATTVSGEQLKIGANRIQLRNYEHGSRLTPPDKTNRYLIELDTDTVVGAGTTDDILMNIAYTDLTGNNKDTGDISIRSYALDFYGYWQGSRDEIGYYANIAEGKTLRFFVPIQSVREITDVTVRVSGNDDWQLKDLRIYTVTSFDRRAVTWKGVSVNGITSDRRFDRSVAGELKFTLSKVFPNPILVRPDSGPISVGPKNTGGIDMTSKTNADWSQLRYSMSYEEASQNLGFSKSRCEYTVIVKVQKDIVTDALYGDCGSKNLFYFRLIFRNGSSAFVLANQQLNADGFRAGKEETFDISTNQDYGDVVAVQIVPDDLSGNSDMYDKLNIEYIEVTRHSNSALTPTWTIHNVGWIGIDYHDDAETQSIIGRDGRSAEEMTHVYTVDGNSYSANLLVTITTARYNDNEPQFKGTLSAEVHYDKTSLPDQRTTVADVVKLMNEYTGHTYSEMMDGQQVSDPSRMFRAEHTDRFVLSLKDIKTIRNIEFFARGVNATTWNIASVTVGLINGEGTIVINRNGEYEQTYASGEGITAQTTCTSEMTPAYHQYVPRLNSTDPPQAIDVYFHEMEVDLSPDAKQWSATIARAPASENDTLNIYLFPTAGEMVAQTSGYDLNMIVQYTDAWAKQQQAATGIMNKVIYNNRPVFYATGVNAKGLTTINTAYIQAESAAMTTMVGIDRGLVQQVRNGVVINEWDLACGVGIADLGIPLGTRTTATNERQRLRLQLGADTDTVLLEAGKTDLAVAMWYRGDDPLGLEQRTQYVYLTDNKAYSELHAGQLIELEFSQCNVAEITGISIATVGTFHASVDAAWMDDREISKTGSGTARIKGEYSFAQPMAVTNVPYRIGPGDTPVSLLALTLNTDKATENVSGGTSGPVRMALGYYDPYGDLRSVTYPDARIYMTGEDRTFRADSTATLRLLVSDMAELRWVELEPYRLNADGTSAKATWNLKSLGAKLGEQGAEIDRGVAQTLVEGAPLRLSMADILMSAEIDTGSGTEARTITGGSTDVLIESGGTVRITPTLTGSDEGIVAKLESYDPATGAVGTANLNDTRGYTRDTLTKKAAQAASDAEAAIWRAAELSTGSFQTDRTPYVFTPPRNYTNGSLSYRIVVSSNESGAAAVTVNVTVRSEADPIQAAIDDLRARQELEAQQSAQSQSANQSAETDALPDAGTPPDADAAQNTDVLESQSAPDAEAPGGAGETDGSAADAGTPQT